MLTYSATGVADSFPMTMSAELTPSVLLSNAVMVSVNNETANERAQLYSNASGFPQVVVVDGGSTQASVVDTSTVLVGASTKLAAAVDTNDVELYADGQTVGTPDTVATMPTVTTMHIGSNHSAANQPYGTIRNVKIFNKRLNDSQVGNL